MGRNQRDLNNTIRTKQPDLSITQRYNASPILDDFLMRCLDKNPKNRFSAEQLLQHELLNYQRYSVIHESEMIQLSHNFISFAQTSQFQSGIICFLIGFQQNKDDRQRLRKRFEAIDTNKDGFITADEMEAYSRGIFENQYESLLGRTVNWRELFSMLDQNNDGKVSYNEFLAGASDKAALLNEEQLRKAFKVLDRDNDGRVGIEEIRSRFSSEVSLKGNPEINTDDTFWDKLLEDLDPERSGFISFENFRDNMSKCFQQHVRNEPLKTEEEQLKIVEEQKQEDDEEEKQDFANLEQVQDEESKSPIKELVLSRNENIN